MTPYFPTHPNKQINWRPVGGFLGLNFGLTLALNLLIYLTGGLTNPAINLLLQFQMLLPAFSAILLILFFFKDHPLYFRRDADPDYPRRSRWFYIFFLAFTVIYGVTGISAMLWPEQLPVFLAIGSSLNILGLLVLIGLRATGGGEDFRLGGLRGGPPRYWLLMGLGFALFYALQTALNAAFGLGQAVDPVAVLADLGQAPGDMSPSVLVLIVGIQTVLIGPFLGLILGFGEEYGWRGYLQGELIKLGKLRGIFLLGIIWGIWHFPMILMGYNYPGQPILGIILMTLYTIGLGFVLGYAMLKTGSVWLAAFLHAVNNQALAFFFSFIYTPDNMALSFGIGIYGLLVLALVVLLILRDPIWQEGTLQAVEA